MADINTLTQNVIEREQGKLELQVEEYRQQVAQEINNNKAKLEEEFAQKKQKLQENRQRQRDISLNSIQLKKRDDVLGVKQEIINQYVQEVYDGLTNANPSDLKQFIFGVIDQVGNTEGMEIVFGDATYDKMKDSFAEFQARGIQVSDQVEAEEAGFILTKGSHQYNYLNRNLIDDFHNRLQEILINQLFQS